LEKQKVRARHLTVGLTDDVKFAEFLLLMGHALFVVGPAGCGKTTFCSELREHYKTQKRRVVSVNLDPAQIHEDIPFDVDIRRHIGLLDVMEETDFGPNGGLLLALEAIAEEMDVLELPEDEEFLLFDCPGQVELYIHSEAMKVITQKVSSMHHTAMAYLLDATHILDKAKFLSGTLSALIAMSKFELPHINLLTKCDLVDADDLEKFLVPDERMLEGLAGIGEDRLTQAIVELISANSLVAFRALDYREPEALEEIAFQIDMCIQYIDSPG
jgi:GPN-loop GTPase